jgi:hypothetical protein
VKRLTIHFKKKSYFKLPSGRRTNHLILGADMGERATAEVKNIVIMGASPSGIGAEAVWPHDLVEDLDDYSRYWSHNMAKAAKMPISEFIEMLAVLDDNFVAKSYSL